MPSTVIKEPLEAELSARGYALILSISATGRAVDLHARIAALVDAKHAEIEAAQVDTTGE